VTHVPKKVNRHASQTDTALQTVQRAPADNLDQAKQLIEFGFEYITDIDEHKLFRKRK
jgi:predicted dithiol-disulfide oxidoreductase (DUF899 family)